jgi:murein DD-endopeptidase MepM/ murein hydrolase activator NlpD
MNNKYIIILKIIVLIGCLFSISNVSFAQERGFGGGGLKSLEKEILKLNLSDFHKNKIEYETRESGELKNSALLADPIGNGGMYSFGKVLTWHVDHDPSLGLKDFMCGQVTYDEHLGTDIGIADFYEMDEGVPVLCAADGQVIEVHDGEFDREWIFEPKLSNYVVLSHGSAYTTSYAHFRKNSVRVALNDNVSVGDTLGFIGSSGTTAFPHLHFEVFNNGRWDPFQGPCKSDESLWIDQGTYTLDRPFEYWFSGLTTLTLNWKMLLERPPSKTHVLLSDTIYSWFRCNYILEGDLLKWEIYENGSLFDAFSYELTLTDVYPWFFFYRALPGDTSYFGNWQVKIYRNEILLDEQNFIYNSQPNETATIQNKSFQLYNDTKIKGEFEAQDPDGSIFWYHITEAPKNGKISQSGGRKRKFTYRPNSGFTGIDTVAFYTIDDELGVGDTGYYYFEVSANPNTITMETSGELKNYNLSQNYPNPFNVTTRIEFQIAKKQFVTLKIYNLIGQEVAELMATYLLPGSYTYTWDASTHASGIYYYRLVTSSMENPSQDLGSNFSYMQTKKLLLIK